MIETSSQSPHALNYLDDTILFYFELDVISNINVKFDYLFIYLFIYFLFFLPFAFLYACTHTYIKIKKTL